MATINPGCPGFSLFGVAWPAMMNGKPCGVITGALYCFGHLILGKSKLVKGEHTKGVGLNERKETFSPPFSVMAPFNSSHLQTFQQDYSPFISSLAQ